MPEAIAQAGQASPEPLFPGPQISTGFRGFKMLQLFFPKLRCVLCSRQVQKLAQSQKADFSVLSPGLFHSLLPSPVGIMEETHRQFLP